VSQGSSGNLHCLRGNGTELAGFPLGSSQSNYSITPTPALADLDGDGKLEILMPSNASNPANNQMYIYTWTGSAYPGWPRPTGTDSESSPVVADFDGDGLPDIVHGGQDGVVRGWNRSGGDLLGFPLAVGDFVRGTPAAGDVDGDGDLDLVLAGWDKSLYVWDFPTPWNPAQALWPAFLHDSQRTALYGFEVQSATDAPDDPAGRVPARLELQPNHPNPFNPSTEIGYGVPAAGGDVRLGIYDVRGRLVRLLVAGFRGPGTHRAVWDGRDAGGRALPSGLYFYRLQLGGESRSRRMLLLK
jgi:hypothetical protein